MNIIDTAISHIVHVLFTNDFMLTYFLERHDFLLPKEIRMIKTLSPFVLLIISNIFMTFAWYGHLKHRSSALWIVILISWLIAFFEYCFQVPANRIGRAVYDTAQLKTMQEVITLIVFCLFSVFYLKEELKWNYIVGFGFIIVAVFFVFKKW